MRTKNSKANGKAVSLKPRHVPQRSCITCRRITGKRELVRLVCSSNVIEIDPRGKKPGRGVYLCSARNCWETGLKSNRIEYALRTKLSMENRQVLLEYSRSLPVKESKQ